MPERTPLAATAPDPAPTNHAELIERYQQHRTAHQATLRRLSDRRTNVLRIVGLAAVLIVWVTSRAAHATGPGWTLAAGFILVAGLIWLSLHLQSRVTRQERLVALYDAHLARVDPAQPAAVRTHTPAEDDLDTLRRPGHLYEADLNLLGPGSLLALLATVRTGPGRRGLADYLLQPATHAESIARQTAVQELKPALDLREDIALLGASSFQQISGGYFDDWLDQPAPLFHPAFRWLLLVTALIAVGLLLTGFLHLAAWSAVLPNLAADLAVQGGLCYLLRERVKPLLAGGARLEGSVRLFSEGLALLQSGHFTCPKLTRLQQRALEPAGAVKTLAALQNQLAIVEQRPKEYFLLLSLLLAAGTQAAIAIAAWKRRHATAMRGWLAAWSEFEALNALATYAFEHPEDAWPELLPPTPQPTFAALALGHPLLPGAVTNDIALGTGNAATQARFFLISGSNMAGKSTLLRSIGINAVLAFAGAPVRAASLRLTPFQLGASLALTDSLAEGKSKFLAEVERLSGIVALAKTTPVLFLVDEIFSGTNSHDRRTAAGAVLASLLAHQAIGALSTHDLALTDLATETNGGLNVHMASPDPTDPLAFDYKLKPGINTSSNALAILRMMGLDA